MRDINSLFKEMVGSILENGFDTEMDKELGYNKYNYHNKENHNSRKGYSKKTMKRSFRDVEINVPHNRNNEFEPKQEINIGQLLQEILKIKFNRHTSQKNIAYMPNSHFILYNHFGDLHKV